MSWLGEFDPNQGHMNASGCGHTLTSETIRGLGIVLRYGYRTESNRVRNAIGARRGVRYGEFLSPTETADKLHCGVIVVDPNTVQLGVDPPLDIHLIEAGRKFDMRGLIDRLDLSSPESNKLRDPNNQTSSYGSPKRAFKHAIDDAVSMLCPIPVLPSSQARWIVWPFRTMSQPYTPMRQIHGIKRLKTLLSGYAASHEYSAQIMQSRPGTVLEPLDSSPLEYLTELLDAIEYLKIHRKTTKIDEQQTICATYERIRDIHRQTGDVFKKIELPNASDDDDDETPPFILVLVAAHVALAVKYGEEADAKALANTDPLPAGSKATDNEDRWHFVQTLAELYAEDLRGSKADDVKHMTIRKHIRRAGYTNLAGPNVKPGVAAALWWTLVVRSVCWWISVRIRLPDTQVPSYWYYSQMPVFIT